MGGSDDPEVPHTVDELVALTGAESVPYSERQLCCGGGVLGYREADSHKLIAKKLDSVLAAGADLLEVHCAFCGVMYDGNQKAAERAAGKAYNVPVLVFAPLRMIIRPVRRLVLQSALNAPRPRADAAKIDN